MEKQVLCQHRKLSYNQIIVLDNVTRWSGRSVGELRRAAIERDHVRVATPGVHPHYNLRTMRPQHKSVPNDEDCRTTSYGHHSFSYSSPSLWNNFPHNIRTASNENIFKHLLKTYLFTH